jgi:predicted DsbA family dithiol-disulfide isomerase
VECSADGGREKTQECQAAGITGYPTWVFADGSRVPGRLSLETLAAHSGCPLEDEEDDDATE